MQYWLHIDFMRFVCIFNVYHRRLVSTDGSTALSLPSSLLRTPSSLSVGKADSQCTSDHCKHSLVCISCLHQSNCTVIHTKCRRCKYPVYLSYVDALQKLNGNTHRYIMLLTCKYVRFITVALIWLFFVS